MGGTPEGKGSDRGARPEGQETSTRLREGRFDRALTWFDSWSERISFALFRLGIFVTMPALVVLVTLDVALRYFFNAPLEWARDVNGILLLITLFATLPHAWDRGYHIRMEVFHSRFEPATRRRADVLASAAGTLFFLLLAVQGARFVPFMMRTGETGEDLDFVLWPFMAVLSICGFVVAARVFGNPGASEDRLRHPSVSVGPVSGPPDEHDTSIPADEDEDGGSR